VSTPWDVEIKFDVLSVCILFEENPSTGRLFPKKEPENRFPS